MLFAQMGYCLCNSGYFDESTLGWCIIQARLAHACIVDNQCFVHDWCTDETYRHIKNNSSSSTTALSNLVHQSVRQVHAYGRYLLCSGRDIATVGWFGEISWSTADWLCEVENDRCSRRRSMGTNCRTSYQWMTNTNCQRVSNIPRCQCSNAIKYYIMYESSITSRSHNQSCSILTNDAGCFLWTNIWMGHLYVYSQLLFEMITNSM